MNPVVQVGDRTSLIGRTLRGVSYRKSGKDYGLVVTAYNGLGFDAPACQVGRGRKHAMKQAYNLAVCGCRVEVWKNGLHIDTYTPGQCI